MLRSPFAPIALFLLAILSGCDPQQTIEKFASDSDKRRAVELIEMMRAGKVDALARKFTRSLQTPDLRSTLAGMPALMPAGEPRKRTLVGAWINVMNGVRSSNLTYQYDFGDRWFMVNCAYVESGPEVGIVGMRINPLPAPLKAQPDFGLRGKSPLQYAVLVAGFLNLALVLLALVRCVVDRNLPRKWLWVIFILVGVSQISVDWSSGAWEFHYFWFLLFSASAVFQPYGSWVVSVALPVGALVYLMRRFWNHPPAELSKAGNS